MSSRSAGWAFMHRVAGRRCRRMAVGLLIAMSVAAGAPSLPSSSLVHSAAYDQSALLELASQLELGLGMPADPQRSMALFCQAARQGNRAAALHIAAWLLTEQGPDDYPNMAADWLHHLQFLERGLIPPRSLPAPRCPTDSPAGLPTGQVALATVVDSLAATQHVDPRLVKAIIAVESGWGSTAVSPKGAMGLMQVMPINFQRLGLSDPFDPMQNLQAGITEIARLLRVYKGDVVMTLAAYNAGEAAVTRCGCVPDNGETLQYVTRVRALTERTAVPSVARK